MNDTASKLDAWTYAGPAAEAMGLNYGNFRRWLDKANVAPLEPADGAGTRLRITLKQQLATAIFRTVSVELHEGVKAAEQAKEAVLNCSNEELSEALTSGKHLLVFVDGCLAPGLYRRDVLVNQELHERLCGRSISQSSSLRVQCVDVNCWLERIFEALERLGAIPKDM